MKARSYVILCLLAATWAVPGRSNEPGKAADVDAPRARESLKTALDRWKKGEAPSALKSARPAIVVQDMDWEGGASLVDYRIEGDGKGDTANLRVPVALSLRDAGGRDAKKSVTYVVGTSPTITVFREIFPQ